MENVAHIIKLRYPVRIGDKPEITELSFQRLNGFHIRSMGSQAGMDAILTFGGKLCGQVSAVIDKLEEEDLTEFVAYVSSKLDGFQPTGR